MIQIQIQILNNFYSHKLKYKSKTPPKEKYASTWNATNIIIYLQMIL
jgi:hypothetical protein